MSNSHQNTESGTRGFSNINSPANPAKLGGQPDVVIFHSHARVTSKLPATHPHPAFPLANVDAADAPGDGQLSSGTP